jgi:hypothetical protein
MTSLPTSAYLRALIAAIDGDDTVPLEIRNECHRLMQAIDANDAVGISTSVHRIEQLASEVAFELPRREGD